MSLSGNENKANPTKKFLSWKGGLGVWEYYDKDKSEKVTLDETIYIVPLDELSTIKGWHDASEAGKYSNEVHDLRSEELTVRSFKGGEIVKGLYSDIKGKLEGGKFCKSVYAAMLDSKGNVVEMVNFGFTGSSLGAWIEAGVKVSDGNVIILSKNPEQKTKGATKYYEPSIKISEKRDAILEECKGMDKELQDYLNQYKAKSTEEPKGMSANGDFDKPQIGELAQPAGVSEEEESDLPF